MGSQFNPKCRKSCTWESRVKKRRLCGDRGGDDMLRPQAEGHPELQRLRGNKDSPLEPSDSPTLQTWISDFQPQQRRISVPPSHQICGHLHHLRKPVHPGCSQQGSVGIWASAPRWRNQVWVVGPVSTARPRPAPVSSGPSVELSLYL